MSREIVKKYLGIPYKHQGRSLKGLDCWGLMMLIYKDLGLDVFDIHDDYDLRWARKGKNYFMENYWRGWDKTDNPLPYDIVLMKNKSGIISHCGMVLLGDVFIHALLNTGVVISSLYDKRYSDSIEGYYRPRGLNR